MSKPKTALLPEPVPAVDTLINLWRVAERLEAAFVPVYAAQGITSQQYNVLRILYVRDGEQGVACQEISARLMHRVPDVTRLLDRLEREQLIERVRCPHDRRVVRSRLTARGHGLVEALHAPLLATHAALTAHMSEAEMHTLDALLRKLGQPLGVPPIASGVTAASANPTDVTTPIPQGEDKP